MKTDARNDRIKFVLDLLNHPEWQREEHVRAWLDQKENKKLYEECRLYLEAGLRKEIGNRLDVTSEYKKFNQKFRHRTVAGIRKWTAIAATIVLITASGVWLATNPGGSEKDATLLTGIPTTQVIPGKKQAVLLTESGKTVVLGHNNLSAIEIETGVMVREDSVKGINYSYASNMKIHYHTLKVPKGGEFRVVLQDGTAVWLNSESELRYPTAFTGDKREIELKGEGYFSVTPDAERPFIVVAAGIRTKVYGTEFNVRSYDAKDVNITLVKGKVGVQRKSARQEYILHPGENACFKENATEISPVNVHKYTAWKEGYFYYENERVETIMNDLKRWYDFDVVYTETKIKNLSFELWASRNSNISAIMELLWKTHKIDIKWDGRTLIISEINRRN